MPEWLKRIKPMAPIHPILVHFTIALTSFSVICDLAGLYFHSESLSSTGWWALATSAIITLFTIVSGFISRTRVAMEESTALAFLRMHVALGPIFYGLLIIMTVWRASVWQAKGGLSGWYLSHDIPNLFICDGSIFPTSTAVNPSLTIEANAARVADRITKLAQAGEIKMT